MRTASLMDILCWLTQPQGPHLVDDMSVQDSFMALAILVTPEALYDADSPQVGLGLVYKPPYIQTASFSEAYFSLKSASQAEAGNRPTNALVTFVWIHESSQVIPLPGVPTLFLDVKTEEDITNSNDPQPPQDFRGFRLHKVLYLGEGMTTGLVALPHLQGATLFHWTTVQRQVLPPELEKVAQLTVTLSPTDSDHWNLRNDIIFLDLHNPGSRNCASNQIQGQTRGLTGLQSHNGYQETWEPGGRSRINPRTSPSIINRMGGG